MMKPANDTGPVPAGPDGDDDIAAVKQAARRAAMQARAAIDPAGAAEALIAHFDQAFPDLAPGTMVSGYWPRTDELDLRPLLRHLAARGMRTCLPVVAGRGWPLLFRLWREGHPLVPGAFKVMEPMQEAPIVRPELVLVPLLAWDRRGMRLGYGAGFYDRTLAALREDGPVLAVGAAYDGQQMDRVPTDPYDQPLDMMLTERGVVRFSPAP
ncbi:5-formyltetrahydrofolate cyclo-ligase [Indioceanicola profundi]|uniref:5-formyltetrahydrofolate cyclo-ligase n=1 Tax=Indioceanicola profundi TaxID=2220096 RepID=UPI001CECFFA9|nr:5-formyltetrahydrofolate cyclo-ligase [Indioceanicola profundi]